MLLKRFVGELPIGSGFGKMIAGSVLAALAIALGMVGVLSLFGWSINPVVPAGVAAVGAGIFAARMRK